MTIVRTTSIAAVAVALPATLFAQDPMPAPAPQEVDPEVAELMSELQEIQQELQPVHQEAMQDPELAGQLQELQGTVEQAMREEDPALFERVDRIQGEIAEAQQAEDQERLQAINAEAMAVQQELAEVEQAVVQRDDVRQRIEAFERAQRDRMIAIDPGSAALLDRSAEIREELDRMQGHPDGH